MHMRAGECTAEEWNKGEENHNHKAFCTDCKAIKAQIALLVLGLLAVFGSLTAIYNKVADSNEKLNEKITAVNNHVIALSTAFGIKIDKSGEVIIPK